MGLIIDKFGKSFRTKVLDENTFKATVKVSVSSTFYGWLFQFGDKMELLAPKNVKDEYMKMISIVEKKI